MREQRGGYQRKPNALSAHKKRVCEYIHPSGGKCRKRTGNGGTNYKYCDLHHKAVTNAAGHEGI